MEHREPQLDARPHRRNAQQDLRAESTMDRDRDIASAERAGLSCQHYQHRNQHEGPPAVHEMDEVGIVENGMRRALRPVDAVGKQAALHQWP